MEERTEFEGVTLGETSGNKKKKKKGGFGKGFIAGIIVMVILAFALQTAYGIIEKKRNADALLDTATTEKLNVLAEYIQEYYYEDVDMESLRDALLHGIFDNLDVYSVYYNADEYETMYNKAVEGVYCGIGASLQQDKETMQVQIVHVYKDSPAEKAGLLEGDIIVSADGYEGTSMELTELITHIRGDEGTSVHLIIYRNNKKMDFDIVRENLSFPTVTSEMMKNQTGYIEVSEFTDKTPQQFEEALDDLKEQGMTSLIVDLRSNPGGLLTSVCEMLDDILPEGLLVYTETGDGTKKEYNSTDEKVLDLPLVVLVDGNSASASEIFAGAIKDRNAGTIVGTTTYGKGVVQGITSFNDGSGFKLTTSRYYTPSGVCINGIGITPDVELEYDFLGGENDSYSYELDNQIQKALEILAQ